MFTVMLQKTTSHMLNSAHVSI